MFIWGDKIKHNTSMGFSQGSKECSHSLRARKTVWREKGEALLHSCHSCDLHKALCAQELTRTHNISLTVMFEMQSGDSILGLPVSKFLGIWGGENLQRVGFGEGRELSGV